MEEEKIDKVDCNKGEHDGVYPTHYKAYRPFRVFPPLPTNLLGDVYVIDKGNYEEPPPTLYPKQKQKVKNKNDDKLSPLLLGIEF